MVQFNQKVKVWFYELSNDEIKMKKKAFKKSNFNVQRTKTISNICKLKYNFYCMVWLDKTPFDFDN